MLALHIFETVFPVFAVVLTGYFYARRDQPDMETINRLTLTVLIPCLLFSALSRQPLILANYLQLVLGAFIIILGSGILVWPLARLMNISAKTLCPPVMFSNAGNLGLPLIVLAFGETALPAAIIIFVVENTLHFSVGIWLLDHRTHAVRALLSPSVVATILGISAGAGGINLPGFIRLPVDMLGDACVPLMLLSLGVRLASIDLGEWRFGLLGALLSPLTGIALASTLIAWLDLPPVQQGALFLFGALPPAVLNFLFAEHYQQEPARVAAIVLMGNALPIVSIPIALSYALPQFSTGG